MAHGSIVASMIAVTVRNTERFSWFLHVCYSSADRPSPLPSSDQSVGGTAIPGQHSAASAEGLRLEEANFGIVGEDQMREQATLLGEIIVESPFPTPPKRMPAGLDDELFLTLVDTSHAFVAENSGNSPRKGCK